MPYVLLRVVKDTARTGMHAFSSTCVLVGSDGSLRIEKLYRQEESKPDAKVFEGRLTEAEGEQLRKLLVSPEFSSVKSKPPAGDRHLRTGLDMLNVSAQPGVDAPKQSFVFMDQQERRAFQEALKPFETWLKELLKRKLPQSKSAFADGCSP